MKDYEGVPLIGPHSLALSRKTGNLFVTDCGYFGETGIQNKHVCLTLMVGECVFDRHGAGWYQTSVSEVSIDANRSCAKQWREDSFCVLDGQQSASTLFPKSIRNILQQVWTSTNPSVFHQFSGRMGPSSITANWDLQLLFVSLYEFKALSH